MDDIANVLDIPVVKNDVLFVDQMMRGRAADAAHTANTILEGLRAGAQIVLREEKDAHKRERQITIWRGRRAEQLLEAAKVERKPNGSYDYMMREPIVMLMEAVARSWLAAEEVGEADRFARTLIAGDPQLWRATGGGSREPSVYQVVETILGNRTSLTWWDCSRKIIRFLARLPLHTEHRDPEMVDVILRTLDRLDQDWLRVMGQMAEAWHGYDSYNAPKERSFTLCVDYIEAIAKASSVVRDLRAFAGYTNQVTTWVVEPGLVRFFAWTWYSKNLEAPHVYYANEFNDSKTKILGWFGEHKINDVAVELIFEARDSKNEPVHHFDERLCVVAES